MSKLHSLLSYYRTSSRHRWLISLGLLFTCLALIYFTFWLFSLRFYETTDDAYVSGNNVQVMSQISGRVVGILADETDLVTKGQPLVYLDKADAEIALKNAETQLALTARQVNDLYRRVDQLRASVALQKSNLEKAKDDYKRRTGLVVNKTITAEDLQHAKIAVDSATASLSLATNQLASAIALVANTDLYHHPEIQQAATNLRNAFLNWRRTTIYAPETGYVAKRPVQIGQQVTANTILMIIVPLNQLWVNANFKESQLKNMRLGQPVTMTSDIYGSSVEFKGHVIGLNPGSGNAFDLLPPQNATGNWIKIIQRLPVRIAIDPDELIKYPLRIGLSMTVSVDTSDRSGKVLSVATVKKIIYQTQDYNEDLKQADKTINKILQDNTQNLSLPNSEGN